MIVPLLPYHLREITSNWATCYYRKKAFSEQMIHKLETLVYNNYTFSKGTTAGDSMKNNNRNIAYISPNEQSKWLYDLLFPIAVEANNELFHFDIDIVTDPIHYVIYPEDGGHLDWHMDVGEGEVNRRKLAMTIQLSDPSEYEGGEFEIWMGTNNGWRQLPAERGDILIFPTFLMHRVKPITRGQRKCLVFWTGGRPFR